jgi:hypothetical protein
MVRSAFFENSLCPKVGSIVRKDHQIASGGVLMMLILPQTPPKWGLEWSMIDDPPSRG